MNFPQIPTDNLYKFLALFGIVLVVTALLLPRHFDQQIQVQAIRAQAEVDVIQAKEEAVQRVFDHLDAFDGAKQMAELNVEKAAAIGRQKEASYLAKESTWLNKVAGRIVILGVLISFIGFGMWYMKLQRWQDQMQREVATKGRKEVDPGVNNIQHPDDRSSRDR